MSKPTSRKLEYKWESFLNLCTYCSIGRVVIIEQVNVAEQDISKFEYKTRLGNESFNDFILSHPSGNDFL